MRIGQEQGGGLRVPLPPGGGGAVSLPITCGIWFYVRPPRNHARRKHQGTVMGKSKHITDSNRLVIEHELRLGTSLKKIAAKISKHHSTVAREIRARNVVSQKGAAGRITNRCVRRTDCNRLQLCIDKPDCTRRCSACSRRWAAQSSWTRIWP